MKARTFAGFALVVGLAIALAWAVAAQELQPTDAEGLYAYVGDADFWVVDVSNPGTPSRVGFLDTPGAIFDIHVVGTYAYIAAGASGGLRVVDVSDPMSPREVSAYDTPGSAEGIYVAGDYAYMADGNEGLRLVDVSNPAHPVERGIYWTYGGIWDVHVAGHYAYVAVGRTGTSPGGMRIVDISNSTSPVEVGTFNLAGDAKGIYVAGSYAYVTGGSYGDYGLWVIDISNPAAPRQVGTYGTSGFAYGVYVSGSYAYVAAGALFVIDVSNPAAPREVGSYGTPGYAHRVHVADNYAYVTDGDLRIVDVSNPFSPHEVGSYATPGEARGIFIAGGVPEPTYAVSGQATDGSGTPISGVTVSDGAGHTGTTDSGGLYMLSGLTAGTYTLTPTKSGWTFTPANRTVSVPPSATGQDFTGSRAGPDLWVDHIQVAQVFLADTDPATGQPIPLIAEKLTLVRVYVGVGGVNSIPNVTARLYVQDAQGQVHVVEQTYNGMPITAKANPDPHNLNDTVNFLPPVSWLKGNVTFWAEVDPADQVAESNESNNTGGNIAKTFQAGHPLRIAWVAMPYTPPNSPPSLVYPDAAAVVAGFNFLRKIYPMGVNDVEVFQQPAQMIEVMRLPFECHQDNPYCPADTEYLAALNRFWEITTRRNGWKGGQPPDRLYGLVPKEAQPITSTLEGIADAYWNNPAKRKGRVAAGLENAGKTILAHELGHLLNRQGLRHTFDDKSDYPDYPPYPQGSIGVWGVDLSAQNALLSPATTYDFMSYSSPIWVSPFHYNKLAQGFTSMSVQKMARALSAPQQQLLVSGLVYTPSLTVTFGTFYPLTSTVPPDASSGTAYCLELRSTTETVLDSRCFDLTFTNPETDEPVNAQAFTLVLPYPEGTRSIVLTHQGEELGRVVASNNAPTVQLLSPNGGESWGASGTYTVTWTAGDPDGDPLRFIVSYSPDNGTTWMPLALDVSTSYLVIDSRNLPGSTSALFKVEATDQMHTAEDISDATFTVEPKAPQVFILSPESDSVMLAGTPVWLEGYAYDLDDGTLSDAALSWSSDRDGDLGTGAQVLTTLSLGRHTLTFRATDSDGNTTTATVQILVTFPEDVVPDCQVDAQDVQAMAGRWRQRSTDPGWDPRFDLAGDGVITVADIMRVAAAWGAGCSLEGQSPAAPTNLQATPISPTSIRLDWDDNSSNETGFRIYDGDILIATVGADTTSYVVEGLASESYHCFRVYAFNDYGNSDWTDWACATTLPACEGEPLTFEQTVAGWIDDTTPAISYCIDVTAGQWASIRMFALPGSSLDPYLKLYDPTGQLATENDDGAGIGLNSFLTYQFPESGQYRLEATRYSNEGDYALRLEEGHEAAVGDIDRDCVVGVADLDTIGATFGSTDQNSDLNLDGTVNSPDMDIINANWNLTCNSGAMRQEKTRETLP